MSTSVPYTLSADGMPGTEVSVSGIEAEVCLDIAERQALGKKKYPTQLALNRAELRARLQQAYEETLDHAAYLKWALTKLDQEAAEEAIRPRHPANFRRHRHPRRPLGEEDFYPPELDD